MSLNASMSSKQTLAGITWGRPGSCLHTATTWLSQHDILNSVDLNTLITTTVQDCQRLYPQHFSAGQFAALSNISAVP